MTDFLFSGIFLGLAAGFSPGPLLALVISETLQHNWRSGMRVALAPILTDAPIVAAVFLALKNFAHGQVLGAITLAGALFVAYLSFDTIRSGNRLPASSDQPAKSLRKAVLVNVLSPHPYLFWASVGGPILLRANEVHFSHGLAFLGGFYAFLVGSKVFLALVAGQSRSFFRGSTYRWTLRVLGLLLLIFALCLFREGLLMFKPDLGWRF
ncbi:MAG: LysE family transporter [Deltaproteobacteria bacterium]|nr:LysE family transporter [Deltaproteobacteria bacterium]